MNILKIGEIEGIAVPIFFDLRAYLMNKPNKVKPFINLAPGYIMYNQTVRVSNVSVTTRGGFYLNAGIGILTPQLGKASPVFLTVNYRKYWFSVEGVGVNRDEFGLTLGIFVKGKKAGGKK